MGIRNILVLTLGSQKVKLYSEATSTIDANFVYKVLSIDEPQTMEVVKRTDVNFILSEDKWVASTINKWLAPNTLPKENLFSTTNELKELLQKKLEATSPEGNSDTNISSIKIGEDIIVTPNVTELAVKQKVWLLPSHLEAIKALFNKGCKIELLDSNGKVVRELEG